jgi:hypothetical protein
MRTAIAVALASLGLIAAEGASAQTTTCRRFGDEVTCNTNNGAAELVSAIRARQAREAAAEAQRRASLEALDARRDREEAAADAAYFNKRLADLIEGGKCDEAQAFALRKGKLDAVDTVLKICRPSTP